MTLAQLYAGDGATTGLNGCYCVSPQDTTRLNVTTTLKDGVLAIEVVEVTLVAGAWVPQAADLSLYIALPDGRIMTDCELTLDAARQFTGMQKYAGPCLMADAGKTAGDEWTSSVAGGGAWEWHGNGNPVQANGTYYFKVDSVFDAALRNGYTFQQYGDGASGGTENIRTVFEGGVCVWSASQSNGGLPGATPVFLTQRFGDRV